MEKYGWRGAKGMERILGLIMYIEEGTFDGLVNLVYIEADPQNTAFYSADGILYRRDGRVFARPQRLM